MIVLALDTSTSLGSVSLCRDTAILAYRESHRQRSHTEFINVAIEDCLHEAQLELKDVDLIAVTLGPGSFTGLRVAGNVAKTFASLFSKKLYAADSLAVLAVKAGNPDLCMGILNAYRNMVFVAAYTKTKVLHQPLALTIPEFELFTKSICTEHQSEKILCLGEAFSEYESEFSAGLKALLLRPQENIDFPDAKILGQMAVSAHRFGQTIEWKSFTPLYIKASAAEENKRSY